MAKPATQRPKLPSVGRLGLVDPSAPADLERLGWNTDAHVELLWSLSRAPDADAALPTMVRLAEAAGKDWDELNQAIVKDKAPSRPPVRGAGVVAGAGRPPRREPAIVACVGR